MAINKRIIRSNDGGAAVPTSFNTVIYDGNSSTQSITGMGFQPDMLWFKSRNSTDNHAIFDSVRPFQFALRPNSTIAEYNNSDTDDLSSIDADGFSLNGNGGTLNESTKTYVAWCWKAGGAAVTNTDGTITSQVSANTEAGFSVVSYTGNETSGSTVGHGLSLAPQIIIVKELDVANNWQVYTSSTGATKFLYLNSTIEALTATNRWNDTTPTDTVFTIGNSLGVNRNSSSYIAYCFAEVAGFSKFGSYLGNGTTSNIINDVGFEPAFLMTKRTDAAGTDWHIWDNKRNPSNPLTLPLFPNEPYGEADYSAYPHNFLSNGFSVNTSNGAFNASGGTYIYMAFANQF